MSTPSPERYRPRKLEIIFGVAIPGMIFAPMLLFGLIGMAVTGAGRNVPKESQDVMGILVAMSMAGLFALSMVALAAFLGPERIKRNAVLRGVVMLGLLAGIVVAGYALWAQRSSVAWSAKGAANASALFVVVPGLLALGGPIVVALRHLPALLRK